MLDRDQIRDSAALAFKRSDVMQEAVTAIMQGLTQIVMQPETDAEARQSALHEYHALSRVFGVIDIWAQTALMKEQTDE